VALLRYSVFGAIDDLMGDLEAVVFEGADELTENALPLQLRHLLHRHEIRFRGSDQARELQRQAPSLVFGMIGALAVVRERLAGRAARQQAVRRVAPGLEKLLGGHVRDGLLREARLVVSLERKSAIGIDVDPQIDVDAGALEAVGQAADSAEEGREISSTMS
jgi:hypothetical protein